MKKLFFLGLFFVLGKVSYCDIMPPHSHEVYKCVKIINAADFTDITLVAYIKHPAGKSWAVGIESNACIDKGYKFNRLEIYAVRKSYLLTKNLDSIAWEKDPNCLIANIDLEPFGDYMENTSPVYSIDEFYKIKGVTDTSVVLYKCREVIKSKNGRPLSIKNYTYQSGVVTLDKTTSTDVDAELYSRSIIFDFWMALWVTILTETLIMFLLFKTVFRTLKLKNSRLLLTGIIASLLTLPCLWFVLPVFIPSSTFLYVLLGELGVVFAESLIIYGVLRINYVKALLVSLICNLASFLLGLWLHHI